MKPFQVHTKVWLEMDGNPVFGTGKSQLLRSIQETGSIQKAARKMHISYRQAWRYLNKITDRFSSPMLIRKQGGKNGGGTTITSHAEEMIEKFERFQSEVQKHAEETYQSIFLT